MGEERAEGTEVIFLSGVDTLCVGDLRQLNYSTVTALLIAPLPFLTPSVCCLPPSSHLLACFPCAGSGNETSAERDGLSSPKLVRVT